MTANPLTTLLERVLSEHEIVPCSEISAFGSQWWANCECGWTTEDRGDHRGAQDIIHRTHVAQALTEALVATANTEWGYRVTTVNGASTVAEPTRSVALARVADLTGRLLPFGYYNGSRFEGAEVVTRTRVTIPPLVTEWEPVTEEAS